MVFVQVIKGRVADAAALKAAFDQWRRDLAPGADGWLGSTAGVTADGRFVAVARFESAAAAGRNSARPEQDAWWAGTAKLLDGEASFADSEDVDLTLEGDPGSAGFVQVFSGRSSDPARARALMGEDSPGWRELRPDILAMLSVAHGDGYTAAVWFTSEAAAREGEAKEPPPELAAQMRELNALSVGEPEVWDLTDPWLAAPH